MAVIDTLKLSKALRDRGIEQKTADAIAEGINEGINENQSELVTKTDLKLAIAGLRNQIWGIGITLVVAFKVLDHFFK
jgi:hypothetical protein